ncbi:hypothetical protein DH2020_002315 [Rehmannia glutinosa]|uniref:Reverse transcriptase Ty1/copia-type domain-containing protein n=1 Tax=Rehmannia glutinosa TaxID=99300 RepID=A0ABR0XTL7_REHGL
MTEEYLALLRNDTWSLVPLPTGRKAIGCKWVFKVKENPDGTINKHKARLVAKGFHQALCALGFVQTKSDHSLFVSNNASTQIFILVYVDDILITGNCAATIQSIVQQLNASFALKDLGEVDYFLGIQVKKTSDGGLHLSQTKYIKDLLCKAKMQLAKGISSPMTSGEKLTAFGSDVVSNPQLYRSIVGALQYITITRPEISFSVNKVCQFMQRPLEAHWKAVKRILRYLSGTLEHGLHLTKNQLPSFDIVGFSDADWATNIEDRRSTSGLCVFLGPNLVSWKSKKQHTISRSSTEAEYRSVAEVVTEISWLQALLLELKVPSSKTTVIWCDNLSTIMLTANPILHARTKHIELDLYFVREKVQQKTVDIRHVPSVDQLADVFTKANSSSSFVDFRNKLKVLDYQTLSLRGAVR